jgi:hypothetical protein
MWRSGRGEGTSNISVVVGAIVCDIADIGVVTTGRRGGAARRDERGEADDDGLGCGAAEGGRGDERTGAASSSAAPLLFTTVPRQQFAVFVRFIRGNNRSSLIKQHAFVPSSDGYNRLV